VLLNSSTSHDVSLNIAQIAPNAARHCISIENSYLIEPTGLTLFKKIIAGRKNRGSK
jgi:hypothetical protein